MNSLILNIVYSINALSLNSGSIVIIGMIVILGMALMVIILYLQNQKAKSFLAAQDDIISRHKQELESKNKEISESTIYARRIQTAILPHPEKTKDILPEHLIFFKPKELVSGDFYWVERRSKKIMFATIDCTGHGIPGGLMSIIGYDGLNRAISDFEITKSDKIITALNDFVIETIQRTGSIDVKDGMQVALCVLNTENNQLEYTGAINPLYIISKKKSIDVDGSAAKPKLSKNQFNLFEIKADRIAIDPGSGAKKFTAHRIQLAKDDRVFIFTDGYADQFGGEEGKKYSYPKFRELLLDIQSLKLTEQKNQLEIDLEKWQGEHEQLDDILIIGVRI